MVKHTFGCAGGKREDFEHCAIKLGSQLAVGNNALPHAPADGLGEAGCPRKLRLHFLPKLLDPFQHVIWMQPRLLQTLVDPPDHFPHVIWIQCRFGRFYNVAHLVIKRRPSSLLPTLRIPLNKNWRYCCHYRGHDGRH